MNTTNNKGENWQEVNIEYVLKNWSILLLADEKELRNNSGLKGPEKLFELKANGSEEEYIYCLQGFAALKKMMQKILRKFEI